MERIGKGGASNYGWPAGASNRYKRLDAYERLLEGTIYEHLGYAFDQEKGSGGKYIPILDRRPAIKYGLAKIVVDQHAAMTFGEAHFPHVRCIQPMQEKQTKGQEATEAACAALIRTMNLPAVMQSALRKGSIGSAALIVKIRDDGTPHIDVVSGKNAKPKLNSGNYAKLDALDRLWPIDGETLADFDYPVAKEDYAKTFWLRTLVDKTDWIWFLPLEDKDYRNIGQKDDNGNVIEWVEDTERSGEHGFSETPAIWLRNLMVGDDAIDGRCTFGEVADICVSIDYVLSQMARGLRYSMDPLLVISMGEMGQASLDLSPKGPGGSNDIVKTAGVLALGEGSQAQLLEITGKGFEASQEFARKMREYAIEVCGGLKSDSENESGPQSGRALELHYQVVVFHIERLRVSYGTDGLLPLLKMLLRALKEGAIDLQDGVNWSGIDLETPLSLTWPAWWAARGSDLMAELTAMQLAAGGSVKAPVPLLAPELVSRIVAQKLDLEDPANAAADAEQYRDEQEQKQEAQAQQQHEQALAMAAVKTEAKPAAQDKG